MRLLFILLISSTNTVQKAVKQQKALACLATDCACDFDTLISCDAAAFEQIDKATFVKKVSVLPIRTLNPNTLATEILRVIKGKSYQGILIGEDTFANDIAVLLSLRKQLKCITNVIQLQRMNNNFRFTRFAYSNNVYVDYQVSEPFVVSLRNLTPCTSSTESLTSKCIFLASQHSTKAIRNQQLLYSAEVITEKDILFACGMGIKSREDIQNIRTFANTYGFSFGVTRPVAMRGWASISEIIGVSGTIFTPKICVTIGISGSAAFYVGIEGSEYILSINTDESATIVYQSDDIIIDDYENVLSALLEQFSQTEHY